MMIAKLSFLVIVINIFFSHSTLASDADELVKQLEVLNTFSGRFQQTLIDDKGEHLQESSGEFFLQRPGLFRWETKAPFPQLLVSNLDFIWLYDADLEQVTVRQYNDKVSATPALLLSGDVGKVKQHYHIKKQTESSYQLIPVEPQELFSELIVSFEKQQLVEMRLKDSLAQTTIFSFIDGVYNQTFSAALFEFSPPEGTDVIVGN